MFYEVLQLLLCLQYNTPAYREPMSISEGNSQKRGSVPRTFPIVESFTSKATQASEEACKYLYSEANLNDSQPPLDRSSWFPKSQVLPATKVALKNHAKASKDNTPVLWL